MQRSKSMCPTARQLKELSELSELREALEKKLEACNTTSPAAAVGNLTLDPMVANHGSSFRTRAGGGLSLSGYPIYRLDMNLRGFVIGEHDEVKRFVGYLNASIKIHEGK